MNKNALKSMMLASALLTSDCDYDYFHNRPKRTQISEPKEKVYLPPRNLDEKDRLKKKLHKQKIKAKRNRNRRRTRR